MLNDKFESKSKQEIKKENYIERRIKVESKYNDGKFIYSWKPETKSWIIGDISQSDSWANAIYDGDYKSCPDEIVFKGIFNSRDYEGNIDNSGEEKEGPVEEVGRWAFNRCGNDSNTKKVVVPKEVKIIREYGFCNMHNVTKFIIEIGSQLESIEYKGLHYIGYNLDDRTDSDPFSSHQKNLILPHTLKSVSAGGIAWCNRFTRIIYCGNHSLNQNNSTLSDKGTYTKVYITPEYEAKNGNSIFGRAAERVLSEGEIDILCSGMSPQQTHSPFLHPLLHILLPHLLLSLHIKSTLVAPNFNSLSSLVFSLCSPPLQPQSSFPTLFSTFNLFPNSHSYLSLFQSTILLHSPLFTL